MTPPGYATEIMYPPLAYAAKRAAFVNTVRSLTGGVKAVACYLPQPTDALTSIDPISGRVWTAAVTFGRQVKPLGQGSFTNFNSSTMNAQTPDTADLTFAETTHPVTLFAVLNIFDTAGDRYIFAKGTTVATDLEYLWLINSTDNHIFQVNDNTAQVQATRTSDAVATQGSWRSYAVTYNSAGGATAANTMILYENGAVVASTATNNAGYVLMRDQSMAGLLGARNTAAPANMFAGGMALFLIIPAVLTAAQLVSLHNACKSYFQI